MSSGMPPGVWFILGAFLIPFFRGTGQKLLLLSIPLVAGLWLFQFPEGASLGLSFMGFSIELFHSDPLSRIFGTIFILMAFAGFLFSLHVVDKKQHAAALLYVGSSLGVVFSGDFLTLFVFWEIMAFSSVFLIWARNTPAAEKAGFRYIFVHLFGGLCLLVGILFRVAETGSLAIEELTLTGLSGPLILIGFLVNAAAPPLHAWLPDAYPESTVTGTVFLSAFTTKTAVYVLARTFAGEGILIWVGILMTLYGIVWAILENDMRRILAYSIINQVGFMVTGIGIGTPLALNGAVSHAFCHILYKALLLMSAGAVLHMTGKSKCTDLGGLYKTMPLTLWFALVGAASISAFPLFSGFVSKAMVISASAKEGMPGVWLLLTLASAGVFLHAGIKFPYFVFFAKDSGIRTQDPPGHMLWAMGIVSFLCIFLGVFPGVLYRVLPYSVGFVPYTTDHVVSQLLLLFYSALAFFLLLEQLRRTRTISLDTDWFYRKGTGVFLWFIRRPGAAFGRTMGDLFFVQIPRGLDWFSRNPLAALKIGWEGFLLAVAGGAGRSSSERLKVQFQRERELYPRDTIRHWPIGYTILWVTLFLLASLLVYYWG